VTAELEETPWPELPIQCPHCGNHGEPGGPWEENGWMPFKLFEEVVRSWMFGATREDDVLLLTADGYSGDWKGETTVSIECQQCFELFPLPEGARVDFD
jgi:hypothetical protein